MSGSGEGDTGRAPAHKRTLRFVYEHSVTLVAVSVAWFVASLPLVTVGPATLGAYAAVRSLREAGALDRRRVAGVLRRNGVHAALLSFLPVTFFAAAGLYLRGGTPNSGFEIVIAVVGVYVGAYLVVALVPTFVAMAAGDPPAAALKRAYVWTASKPTAALSLALVTAVIFAVTALLTIGFVLLFPAVAFSYHVEYLADDFDVTTAVDPSRTASAPFA
ncbi:hypothetical protein [Haloarcula onubensis]|uniref:DUF624 domain-containing protein n=1 Tax=Haloarcula onubensis TaxID=2950539 RepID=A0ABU2FK57_9EURY|nr:hypothetical protein [Halomicroarcula sp. S3CR25-11]MDS0280682.1 hypothetical protein [Halomicroarcula sp. S3CR25-11]